MHDFDPIGERLALRVAARLLRRHLTPFGPDRHLSEAQIEADERERMRAEDQERRAIAEAEARGSRLAEAEARGRASVVAPPKDRGQTMKREALITSLRGRWPTIESDLKHAGRNGLAAAKAASEGKGLWWEGDVLAWGRSRGKLPAEGVPGSSALASVIHRIKG